MRRNTLLAAGMLSVLLATSACSAGTGTPATSAQPVEANAGIEASSSAWGGTSSSEVGISQRAAAEKAKQADKAKQAAAAAAEKAGKAVAAETAKKIEADAAAEKAKAAAAAAAKAAAALEQAAGRPPAVGPAPAPTAAVPAAPKPAAAPAVPSSSSERSVTTAYTAAYTWYDNTAADSDAISHGGPHTADGGTGTYEDPITIAVESLATGQDVLDFPAGTRIYLPDVRRYFIVEDICGHGRDREGGPCHQGADDHRTNSTVWIGMWIGGESVDADAANACANRVTNVGTAVFHPASNYAVAPGAGVLHDGKCDAGYGNVLVKQ
ncbi:hypothetical protein [Arthrobacter sp. Z4-13]